MVAPDMTVKVLASSRVALVESELGLGCFIVDRNDWLDCTLLYTGRAAAVFSVFAKNITILPRAHFGKIDGWVNSFFIIFPSGAKEPCCPPLHGRARPIS
jgi:hypothetical protein